MRAVIQRVTSSSVTVDEEVVGRIGKGITVLLGVGPEDEIEDARYLAQKIVALRIFPDAAGKMNLSLLDVGGEILSISQFTLYGDCRKGRRPSFAGAAEPATGQRLYHEFNEILAEQRIKVATGSFGANMQVELVNDGPVTLMLDSKKHF